MGSQAKRPCWELLTLLPLMQTQQQRSAAALQRTRETHYVQE